MEFLTPTCVVCHLLRRLQLTHKPDQQGALLSKVPSLRSVTGGSCALVRALLTLLRYRNDDTSWDELMCLTGIAFLTPVTEKLEQATGDAERCSGLTAGLAALGYAANWHYPLVAGQVEVLVKQSVENQFPLLILGWPHETDDWGLLTGYDPARGVVCGWPAQGEPDGSYLGAKPGGVAAVTLVSGNNPLDDDIRFIEALHRITGRFNQVKAGWLRWQEALQAVDEMHNEQRQALVLRHRVALDEVADARMAAGTWLREYGENLPGEAGEYLYEAAELCLELASKAEVAEFDQVSEIDEFDNLKSQEQEKALFEVSLISKLDEDVFSCLQQAVQALEEGY